MKNGLTRSLEMALKGKRRVLELHKLMEGNFQLSIVYKKLHLRTFFKTKV